MYAIYARQSVYRDDSISIKTQIERCQYETNGEPSKVYSDEGFSGKNTDRPHFKEMINDIKQGKITHVVVYKLDRISRSIIDFVNITDTFNKYNVEFISCNEKFDTSTPMGRAMLNICITFAQLERETIQMRVIDAYRSRSKRGFYMGGKVPYGFKREDTVIDGIKTAMYIEEPTESTHVKLMYQLYADSSNSLGDIIRYFNKNGIVHNRGKLWSTPRISEILRNPVYVKANADIYTFFAGKGTEIATPVECFNGECGCYLYSNIGSEKKVHKRSSVLNDKLLVLAPHKGFISSEEWLKCRTRCMNNKQSTKTNKPRNSWLLGKVKCGNCGGSLSLTKSNTKMGRYFQCGTELATKKIGCNGTGGTIYADLLEDNILTNIKEKLKEFNSLTYNDVNTNQIEINKIKVQIAQIEKDITEWVDKVQFTDGSLIERIAVKIEKLENQKRTLNEQIAKLTQSVSPKTISNISSLAKNWNKISFEDKQTIVDTLIEVITIANTNINIKWRI